MNSHVKLESPKKKVKGCRPVARVKTPCCMSSTRAYFITQKCEIIKQWEPDPNVESSPAVMFHVPYELT